MGVLAAVQTLWLTRHNDVSKVDLVPFEIQKSIRRFRSSPLHSGLKLLQATAMTGIPWFPERPIQ